MEIRPLSARRLLGNVTLSLLLHLIAIAVILHHRTPDIAPMRLPGTSHGSHIELTFFPGRAPVRTSTPIPAARAQPTTPAPPLVARVSAPVTPAPASPNANAPSSTQPDSAAGADALGDGNVNIALATFFPRPRPDLSSLSHGAAGDVILDIVIDSAGRISGITLTHGLGPGIDDTVVATVQRWTFHPATRDGQPIASEQELHFHYERG